MLQRVIFQIDVRTVEGKFLLQRKIRSNDIRLLINCFCFRPKKLNLFLKQLEENQENHWLLLTTSP